MEKQLSLMEWYKKPFGQYIYMQEYVQLERYLPQLPGSNLVQLGLMKQMDWLKASSIPHKLGIEVFTLPWTSYPVVKSRYTSLPLRNESVEVVLLPHTLETDELEANAIIAEAWRVLASQGHLVILSFNPWSLWKLLQLFPKKRRFFPRDQHLHSAQKVRHWILNNGAEITVEKTFCYSLPIDTVIDSPKNRSIEKIGPLLLPYAGSIYLMIAKKQVTPITPLRPSWTWEKTFANKGVGAPSVGRVRRG